MFENKKRKRELQELEEQKKELTREREELLKIKEIMEDKSPKIDITDVYVFEINGISYIVKYYVDRIRGQLLSGRVTNGYRSTLVDIFTKKIIHQKDSLAKIKRKEAVFGGDYKTDLHYAYLTPICEKEKSLLAYIDKKVPLYVLQRLYYKLNDVDLSSQLLENPQIVKTLKK